MRREPEIERAPGVFEGFFMGTADGGSIIADACTMEPYGCRKAQAGSPSAPQSVKKLPKRLRFWYKGHGLRMAV